MLPAKHRGYIGVDPGISGALALYVPELGALRIADMPTDKTPKGKHVVDMWTLAALLRNWEQDFTVHGIIERVSASPQMGVTSAFTFGASYGALQQAFASAGISFTLITPAVWKGIYGLSGGRENKGASVAKAAGLFPNVRDLFFGAKGGGKDGRAEAALLAHYGSKLA